MNGPYACQGQSFGRSMLRIQRSHRTDRPTLLVLAQTNNRDWKLRAASFSAVIRQLAVARRSQWQDVRSSLCIGVGTSALAYNGGSGPNGPSSGGGGNGFSGGDGWHAGPGQSSTSNVLSDVAAANDCSSDTAEQVILLDVGGKLSTSRQKSHQHSHHCS